MVDSPLDFYSSRIPKKERKRTIVEELLADAEFRRYSEDMFHCPYISSVSAMLVMREYLYFSVAHISILLLSTVKKKKKKGK